MSGLINRAFELGRDSVAWSATGKLILLRSASSAFTFVSIMFIFSDQPVPFFSALLGSFIVFTIIFVPVALLGFFISKIFPPAGILSLPALILIPIGDPLLWIGKKFVPQYFPADEFNFYNFNAIIFVMNREVVRQAAMDVKDAVGTKGSELFDEIRSRANNSDQGK